MAEKSFKPPAGAVAAAKRALKKRAEASPSNRGGTAVGLARARDIAAGKSLPLGTVKSRIHAATATFAEQWKAAARRSRGADADKEFKA